MARIPNPVRAGSGNLMAFNMPTSAPVQVNDFGRPIQQFGQAMQGLGAQGMQIATDMMVEANRVQFIGAQNAARRSANALTYGNGEGGDEPGFLAVKGEAALLSKDNADLSTSYGQRLREQLDQVQAGLGNDAQRQAFGVWRGSFEQEFGEGVQRHQRTEFARVRESNYKGSIELGINAVAADWGDARKVREHIEGVAVPGNDKERYGGLRQTAYQLAQARGLSATEAEFEVKRIVSQAHLGVLTQALAAQDSRYAMAYMRAHKGDMLENDVLKINGTLTQHVEATQAQQGVAVADRTLARKFQPTDMDGLVGAVLHQESRNRDWADADKKVPLTSPAGAKYAMQVMPATARDPGFGINPAASDTPEEYNRVGRELLGVLVKRYGNTAQALAAYNGGPGHVDKAVADARKKGDESLWMQELRKYKGAAAYEENTSYVRSIMGRLNTGGGTPARPTEAEYVGAAVQSLGANPSPNAVKLTQQAAEHRFRTLSRSIDQQEEQAYGAAAEALWQNGGRFDQLPPAVLNAVPAAKRAGLLELAGKIGKGDEIKTDFGLYYELSSNPEKLAAVNLAPFFDKLAPAERKELIREQQKLRTEKEPAMTAVQGVGDMVKTMAREVGINPAKDAEKMGVVYAEVQKRIADAEQQKGGKLNPNELREVVGRSFTKVSVEGRLWGTNEKPAFALKPTDKVVVPQAERTKIVQALLGQGKPVNEETILRLYRMSKGLQ